MLVKNAKTNEMNSVEYFFAGFRKGQEIRAALKEKMKDIEKPEMKEPIVMYQSNGQVQVIGESVIWCWDKIVARIKIYLK